MSLIKSFVDRCLADGSKRIAVVGDSMIDSYYQVSVDRISPEFKIPVMLATNDQPDKCVPGGAANVARQLSELNCNHDLISLVDDKMGSVLRDHGIKHERSVYHHDLKVPEKKRFYDQDFPLCRLDVEQPNYGIDQKTLDVIRNQFINDYKIYKQNHDILILSDYGKGFFNDSGCFHWCNLGISTIVDPKAESCTNWHRCKVFKPNSKDAYLITGEKDKSEQVRLIKEFLDCENVVVTDSGNGIYGWDGKSYDYFEIKNEQKVIPRSVIGAGDCFSAFLAIAITHGFSIRDASEISFKAGLQYVGNIHNEPVTLYDLLKSEDPIGAKYLPPRKKGDESLVWVNGCFDVLHSGHIAFLRFAASKGDRLIVALNSDASISRLKGPNRPIRSLKDRMEAVACLEFVDYVTSFEENTPDEHINKINPNTIVASQEYYNIVPSYHERHEVYYFPRIKGFSTTEEIERIRS